MARRKDDLQKAILREVMCNDLRNNGIEIGITNYLDYANKVQEGQLYTKNYIENLRLNLRKL